MQDAIKSSVTMHSVEDFSNSTFTFLTHTIQGNLKLRGKNLRGDSTHQDKQY